MKVCLHDFNPREFRKASTCNTSQVLAQLHRDDLVAASSEVEGRVPGTWANLQDTRRRRHT
jgi:hypothetical protein